MNINEIVYEKSRSQNTSSAPVGGKKSVSAQSTEKVKKPININDVPASLNHASKQYAKNLNQDEAGKNSIVPEDKSNVACFQDVMDRMTEEDAKSMEDEGMTFEKYEAERLDRTLDRIKEQKQMKEDAINNEVEKRQEREEDVERIAIQNACEGYASEQVVQALQAANLPLTKENAIRIAQALEMSTNASGLTDAGMQYMVQNQLDPTIQNFYQADHIAHSHNAYGSGINVGSREESWLELEEQVKGILENAGMEPSGEHMEQCKWLFFHDLPITKESIQNLNEIQSIKQNYNQDEVLDKIIDTFETGTVPENTSLSFLSGNAKHVTEEFLKQIEQMLNNSEMDIHDVTSRRQLEEVRMKMTTEVSQKLLEKGIRIDIGHIQDVIDGLKEIEDEYYKGLLSEANVEPTADTVELLKDTTKKLYEISNAPNVMLGKTFVDRNEQTVDTLHAAAKECSQEFEKANQSYETMMTEPRKDLGDSIKKAFQNIDSILKDLGLEETEANRRAVRILGYNSIEITAESIAEMKNYDSKVQTLLKGMSPSVTVEMIKEGINPLDVSIDELNDEVKEIKEKLGVSDEEKYSEFLWKLDKNKELSESERKAYIGIYRMLHQVEKSDGAAIGSVIKSGRELTLSNLMTAVRTSKSHGIDQSVDDSFGELKELNFKNETIGQQVEYYRQMASDILREISPDGLQEVLENEGLSPENLDISLEKLGEKLDSIEDESHREYLREKIERIQQQIDLSNDTVAYLEALNQPITLENVLAYEALSKKDFWKNVLEQAEDGEEGELEQAANQVISELDGETSEKYVEELVDKASDMVKHQLEKDDNNFKDVSLLRLMGSSLCLTGALARQESYHIPIIVGNSVTDVNVTVVHKEEGLGKAEVAVHSDYLGEVKAELSVRGNEVKGFILADSQAALEQLRQAEDGFREQLNKDGLSVKQIDLGFYQGMKQTVPENGSENVDTKTLLKVAKTFISMIRTIEQVKGESYVN